MSSDEGPEILKNWLSTKVKLTSSTCGLKGVTARELRVRVSSLDASWLLLTEDETGVPSMRPMEGAQFIVSRTDKSLVVRISFSNGTCIELTEDLSAK